MDRKLFVCQCENLNHSFCISKDDVDGSFLFELHLSEFPFYKRCILAVKYIFNFSSKYGHFEDVLLSKEQVSQLINQLKEKE
jgi:hypothetical protein